MKLYTPFTCPECGKPKGIHYNHSKCSKNIQKDHAKDKRVKMISSDKQIERLVKFISNT